MKAYEEFAESSLGSHCDQICEDQGRETAQLVEYSPNMYEVLCSNTITRENQAWWQEVEAEKSEVQGCLHLQSLRPV